jgi:hypothetical protein
MFNKKGQAALEFLTTYGWAFLVILVMIGALSYFGVFSPENYVPDQCNFGSVLSCSGGYGMSYDEGVDLDVETDDISTIEIDFSNIMADGMNIVTIEMKEKTIAGWTNVEDYATWTIGGAEAAVNETELDAHSTGLLTITIDDTADPVTDQNILQNFAGDKKNFLFKIIYTKTGSTINNIVEGTVTTTVLEV